MESLTGGHAGNYWTGPNPAGLIPPPTWWLDEMRKFDSYLVLFPSIRQKGVYIMGRRAKHSHGEALHDARDSGTGKILPQNPDTVFMHEHRLVRVCAIAPGVLWDMRVFAKLAAHDIRRLGGATVVADRLDAMDEKNRHRIDIAQHDEVTARSRSAYLGYKTRIGERISLAKSQGRGTLVKKPVSVSVRQSSIPSTPHPA